MEMDERYKIWMKFNFFSFDYKQLNNNNVICCKPPIDYNSKPQSTPNKNTKIYLLANNVFTRSSNHLTIERSIYNRDLLTSKLHLI